MIAVTPPAFVGVTRGPQRVYETSGIGVRNQPERLYESPESASGAADQDRTGTFSLEGSPERPEANPDGQYWQLMPMS